MEGLEVMEVAGLAGDLRNTAPSPTQPWSAGWNREPGRDEGSGSPGLRRHGEVVASREDVLADRFGPRGGEPSGGDGNETESDEYGEEQCVVEARAPSPPRSTPIVAEHVEPLSMTSLMTSFRSVARQVEAEHAEHVEDARFNAHEGEQLMEMLAAVKLEDEVHGMPYLY